MPRDVILLIKHSLICPSGAGEVSFPGATDGPKRVNDNYDHDRDCDDDSGGDDGGGDDDCGERFPLVYRLSRKVNYAKC